MMVTNLSHLTTGNKPAVFRLSSLAQSIALSLGLLGSLNANANPTGANIQVGEFNITELGDQMTIEQLTQMGIINWDSFSIGESQHLNIEQLGIDSALLNRVTGADPSELLGQLSANGRVYVVNPNGVLVGKDASINAAEFIASTLDVADADFMENGALTFAGDSPAPVVNLGEITAQNGDVILVAQVVQNRGTIQASQGTAGLAAGNKVLYQPKAQQQVYIESGSEKTSKIGVDNSGWIDAAQAELKAAGGSVYELAINQQGVIRATGVQHKNGRVILTAKAGSIHHHGQISAHHVDGSGGEVNIGGGFQGQDSLFDNADYVQVSAQASINVAATSATADGGKLIVWSDRQTDFFGQIYGQGGHKQGNGGFVEVSGKKTLNYWGLANLSASEGQTGTLLLDPDEAIISNASNDPANGIFNTAVLANNLNTASVIINTSGWGDGLSTFGHIFVNSDLSWNSPNNLTLKANGSVLVNANIQAPTGSELIFQAGPSHVVQTAVRLDSNAHITAERLTIEQNKDISYGSANPPLPNLLELGFIKLDGQLQVDTLDVRAENMGVLSVTATNPLNHISHFFNSGDTGRFAEGISLFSNAPSLNISGTFATEFGGDIRMVGKQLTLDTSTTLKTGQNADIILAATTGAFTNHAGSSALQPGTNGRYLVYSDAPDTTEKGGLTGKPIYDRSYANHAPGSISAAGNRFLYRLAPVLTFSADDILRSLNTANPPLTYSVSGLVGGDLAAEVFNGTPLLSTAANQSSAVGDYSIAIEIGSLSFSDYNYGVQFQNGTLSVSGDKILSIIADDLHRYFGDPNPAFTASYSGFQGGDDASLLDGFDLQFTTQATLHSPVGTYVIMPSGATTLSDYDVMYQPGTLTINPRLLTIRADSYQIDYLDSLPSFTATFDGLASFHTASDFSSPIMTPPTVGGIGNYQIGVSGVSHSNYQIQFVPGTLKVRPRHITATVHDTSRMYGQQNPGFSLSFANLNGHHSNVVGTSGLQFSTLATQYSDVGTYDISASGIHNPNFEISYQSGRLSVVPANLTIQANNLNRIYGDENPELTYQYSGLVGTDTLFDVVSDFSINTDADLLSNVGNYAIQLQGSSSGNYSLNLINGHLQVTHAPISLLSIMDASRLYGDSDPTFALQVEGLKNGEQLDDALKYYFTTTANERSWVGVYDINVFIVDNGNYMIAPGAKQKGRLTITPRPLVISADNLTRLYGEDNPEFTATYDGLAWFDSPDVIQGLEFWTPADRFSNVLDYGLNLRGGSNPNYQISLVAGTLSVTPAPIYFDALSTSLIYGENANDKAFATYQAGLKNGESISSLGIVVDAGGAKDAGLHPVNISLANTNYYVAPHTGTIEIRPRPITLSIADVTRIYGNGLTHPLPVIVGGMGLVDDASEVFEFANLPGKQADVGTYLVEAALLSGNYELLSVDPGILTVTPRLIALKPVNTSHTYGDSFMGVDYLVAGADGLADFHTVDDLVADTLYRQFTRGIHYGEQYAYERLNNGLEFLGSLLGSVTGFGASISPGGYQTKALFTDMALKNYHIISAPGALSVVPRPVTLTVLDAIGIRNHFVNPFLAYVENLAEADQDLSFATLFPDLRFQLVPEGAKSYEQREVEVTNLPFAPALTDSEFFSRYREGDVPSTASNIDVDDSSGSNTDITVPDSQFDSSPIDLDVQTDDQSVLIEVLPDQEISVGNTTVITQNGGVVREETVEARPDARLMTEKWLIRPTNMKNNNYVVTKVNLGTLTIAPDPQEVAAVREEQRLEAMHKKLYDPGYISGNITVSSPMALGFTRETIPVALDALTWLIEQQRAQGSDTLWELIKSKMPLKDKNRSYQHTLELFLAELHYDTDLQSFMTGIMKDYAHAMMRGDIPAVTDAQKAYKAKLDKHVNAAKEGLARKIKENIDTYQKRNSAESRELRQREQLLKSNRDALSSTYDELDATLAEIDALSAGNGVVNEAALALLRARADQLSNSLDQLRKNQDNIKSPEAIKARLEVIKALGGQPDMADTLLGGDIPYRDLVNNALVDLTEESIALLAGNTAGGTIAAGGSGGAFTGSALTIAMQGAKEAQIRALSLSGEAGSKAAQQMILKAQQKAAQTVLKKGMSKVLGSIFKNSVNFLPKLATHAGALSGGAAGVGFGLSVGISRAIMIAELADGQAFVESLTQNAAGRKLNLVPDNVEGHKQIVNQNTEVKIDNTLFNLGFMSMLSGQSSVQLSSGFKI